MGETFRSGMLPKSQTCLQCLILHLHLMETFRSGMLPKSQTCLVRLLLHLHLMETFRNGMLTRSLPCITCSLKVKISTKHYVHGCNLQISRRKLVLPICLQDPPAQINPAHP